MPYNKQENRKSGLIASKGDVVYQLTMVMLQVWKESPRFDTIASLRKMFVTEPKNNELLNHMRSDLAGSFTVGDLYTCAERAFAELDRRLFSKYEKLKKLENGDIPELAEAIKDVEAKIKAAEAPVIVEVK